MNTPKIKVAEYLTIKIEESGKKQSEIANALGLSNPNFITMLKQGRVKLPLLRVHSISEALGCDPAELMHLVMSEYHPNMLESLLTCLKKRIVTQEEADFIEKIKLRNGGKLPLTDRE